VAKQAIFDHCGTHQAVRTHQFYRYKYSEIQCQDTKQEHRITLDNVQIQIVNLDPSLIVADQLPTGRITLLPEAGQDQIATATAHLQADFKGITKPGVYSIPLIANVPEGFEVEAYDPLVINVRVRSAPPGQFWNRESIASRSESFAAKPGLSESAVKVTIAL